MNWFLYLAAVHVLAFVGIIWTCAWLVFHFTAYRNSDPIEHFDGDVK